MDMLEKQLAEILANYKGKVDASVNQALVEASKELLPHLISASPHDPKSKGKHFKDSWEVETKYNNVKYIGNTKTAERYGRERNKGYSNNLPLSNIIEFTPQHKPFIRKTFETHKEKVYNTFLKEVAKKA